MLQLAVRQSPPPPPLIALASSTEDWWGSSRDLAQAGALQLTVGLGPLHRRYLNWRWGLKSSRVPCPGAVLSGALQLAVGLGPPPPWLFALMHNVQGRS